MLMSVTAFRSMTSPSNATTVRVTWTGVRPTARRRVPSPVVGANPARTVSGSITGDPERVLQKVCRGPVYDRVAVTRAHEGHKGLISVPDSPPCSIQHAVGT